tara:strand:- start:158 stop:523 length:366 start_codon:yes stop_codon:yes gene_type:complete
MKQLLLICAVAVLAGCGKELTTEDVAGTYESSLDRGPDGTKLVFKENGLVEAYMEGKKLGGVPSKWNLVNGELHYIDPDGFTRVFRINKDRNITSIGTIGSDGKRSDSAEFAQIPYIKISQ